MINLESLNLKEIVINICNKIIVQIVDITSRIDVHLEVRKGIHRKLTNFNQNNVNLLYIELHKLRDSSSFFTLRKNCEQPSSQIGMGSMSLPRFCHEEHNDTYCDLPSTFLLDGFAFKSHS